MNHKVKNILVYTFIGLLVVVMSIAGTMAFLTTQEEVVNQFEFGKIKVLLEDDLAPSGTDIIYLAPGDMKLREPYVKVPAKSSDFNEVIPSVVRVIITVQPNANNQQDLIDFITLEGVSANWDFTRFDTSNQNMKKFVGIIQAVPSPILNRKRRLCLREFVWNQTTQLSALVLTPY